MRIDIDAEFKALIPPLSSEEFNQLEANIIADGCRDPLVLWGNVLVDGHNRYEICTTHDIAFKTQQIEFQDVSAVKIWMIDNQAGRRNITDGWKYELAQKKKAILLEKGREKQSPGINQYTERSLSTVDNEQKHNTQKEIATGLGWSTGKVAMADKVWNKAPEEVKEKVKSGEVSINQAYKEIVKNEKKVERAAIIEKQKEDIAKGNFDLPEGQYNVIAIDPPWNYGREYDPDGSRVANPYPEMNQQELLSIDLPAAKDAVLFLWTTQAFIFDAKELLDRWGFTYKATLVWNKERIGMGHWLRMQCEFCLIGIKGSPIWSNTKWRDIISESRREHSRKPEAFYEMVEEITAGKRLEYFSREAREGWEVFGNDTTKFSAGA